MRQGPDKVQGLYLTKGKTKQGVVGRVEAGCQRGVEHAQGFTPSLCCLNLPCWKEWDLLRVQGWIQAKGGQSCYPNQHHDSSPVPGKEMQPHLLLRMEQFYFSCLFARGVQESKSHSLVLGQGDVGSFSWCQPLGNFGGFRWRTLSEFWTGAWTLPQRQESEMVHCNW